MMNAVGQILRRAAQEAILPRYQNLAAGDIQEKTPGEIATIADHEAEQLITRALLHLLPGARVVGEEAASKDSSLLEHLGDNTVWLVDPLDGTANFASGRGPFATMAALLISGEIVASWIFDPISDRLFVAERGSGAFVNGKRISTAQDSPGAANLCGVVATGFMPPDLQAAMKTRMQKINALRPLMLCAGTEYPDIATGERHFALYWRTLAWDHAPGALFLTEAGGWVARHDGTAFKVTDPRPGLLVARNKAVWEDAAAFLIKEAP
jgi:fructose-1,6-bisphosphatase/inositol monophosphatase family enzyme